MPEPSTPEQPNPEQPNPEQPNPEQPNPEQPNPEQRRSASQEPAPRRSDDEPPTLYDWAGGAEALLRLTRTFYGRFVPADELIGPLFAHMSADHPERVAAWLGEVFGGPAAYSDRYGGEQGGYARMLSQHTGRGLREEQRARWVALLLRSADEVGLPRDPEFRSAFVSYIEWGSRLAWENSQPGARPPARMPVPRWDWGTAGPPGVRISALAERSEPAAADELVLPGPEVTPGFEEHIRPLFRESDRRAMRWAFDLWAYDDVTGHAAAILERIEAGTMPCDAPWPDERTAVLRRWIDAGKPV